MGFTGRRPRQPPPRGAAIGGVVGPGYRPAARAVGVAARGFRRALYRVLGLLRDMEISCRYIIFYMRYQIVVLLWMSRWWERE